MALAGRQRSREERLNNLVEVICVVLVLVAIGGLVAWIVTHSGGGVLNQGAVRFPLG